MISLNRFRWCNSTPSPRPWHRPPRSRGSASRSAHGRLSATTSRIMAHAHRAPVRGASRQIAAATRADAWAILRSSRSSICCRCGWNRRSCVHLDGVGCRSGRIQHPSIRAVVGRGVLRPPQEPGQDTFRCRPGAKARLFRRGAVTGGLTLITLPAAHGPLSDSYGHRGTPRALGRSPGRPPLTREGPAQAVAIARWLPPIAVPGEGRDADAHPHRRR